MVILKKFYDQVVSACKEHKYVLMDSSEKEYRYTVRPFEYSAEGTETESEAQQLSVLQTSVKVRRV